MNYLMSLLFLFGAFAGDEAGNGGDAIVCDKSVQLFDYYESKMLKRFTIVLEPGKDYRAIARRTVDRLKKFNPQLHRQYSKVLGKIPSRLQFIENANFRDVKDSFEVAVPKNCKIQQIAIQQDDRGTRYIRISKDLWNQLSPKHRAGLILHEIIYEHFIFLGEKNSIKARAFNSFLSSKEIKSMDRSGYTQFVRSLKVPIY